MALFDNIFSGENGVANTLIDLFGEDGSEAVLIQKRIDTEDDITGIVNYLTKETNITITPLLKYKLNDIDNTVIKTGDVYTLIKATDIDSIWNIELHSDKIVINNKDYYIVGINPTETGKLTAMYKVQLRTK